MSSNTIFDVEQTWGAPVNYDRRRWPQSPTGKPEEAVEYTAAALEILTDAVWRGMIQRGLEDSATGRVRSLRAYLASDG